MNIDIIVPVLGRPEHAQVFNDSLAESFDIERHVVKVYAVCENYEDDAAWRYYGEAWGSPGYHTFAEKVNYGYQLTEADWVLLVGSDVKFHEGWIDELVKVAAEMPAAYVLGTKDLGNPRVMAGEHTCHPVIYREYIDQIGASWDGPGVVCHEYKHCFVDDEIVQAAKQRGVWYPTEAIIEHMHPYWGKGNYDEVYQEGESWLKMDQITWQRRLRQYGSPSPT